MMVILFWTVIREKTLWTRKSACIWVLPTLRWRHSPVCRKKSSGGSVRRPKKMFCTRNSHLYPVCGGIENCFSCYWSETVGLRYWRRGRIYERLLRWTISFCAANNFSPSSHTSVIWQTHQLLGDAVNEIKSYKGNFHALYRTIYRIHRFYHCPTITELMDHF